MNKKYGYQIDLNKKNKKNKKKTKDIFEKVKIV